MTIILYSNGFNKDYNYNIEILFRNTIIMSLNSLRYNNLKNRILLIYVINQYLKLKINKLIWYKLNIYYIYYYKIKKLIFNQNKH